MVFIYDFQLAKEVAFDDKFSGRNVREYTSEFRGYGRNIGVIFTETEVWKTNRRFALSTLKGISSVQN